jgi:hypothetical protein
VVHQTVDGETILIDLETGNYYSLTGAAAEIWGLVAVSRSEQDIARELAERHGRPAEEVDSAVSELLSRLSEEGLLAPSEHAAAPTNGDAPPVWQAESWAPPKFEKFEDLQNFLLVDPVHEVDDVGWPTRKPD